MLKSKTFKVLVSILISALLIGLICNHADWNEVGNALAGVKDKIFYLIPALAMFLLHYVFRALRWEYLLGKKTSFLARYNAIQFGNFTTYILPFRAGEFLRPFYLCKKANLKYPSTFISIVTERFFDLVMALGCLASMLYLLKDNTKLNEIEGMQIIYNGSYALLALAVAIFVFIVIAIYNDKILFSLFDFSKKFLPKKFEGKFTDKFLPILKNLVEGVKPLKSPKNFIMTTILSAIVWISTVLFYYAFLFLFFDTPSLELALAIVVCVAFAVAVPSAPGFIGVFQWGCILAFSIYSESRDVAVAYSIIAHMGHYLVFMVYGGILLLVSGVKLGDKARLENEVHELEKSI